MKKITFFLFLSLIFLGSNKIKAQERLPLTVTPSRQEITVNPGEKTGFVVKFTNAGNTPVSGILKVVDFIVKDKEGSPVFIEDPSQISPRFTAASWVSLPYQELVIPAKEKITVNAHLTVPEDAEPGGRYIAVYLQTTPPPPPDKSSEEKQLAISTRLAALISIRVSGPITEDARLVKFTAPSFLEYGPVKITTEILNLGSYHIKPKGTIILFNFFGKEVGQTTLKEENIFPQVSRVFENEVGKKWMFGKYKAELTAAYGEGGKVLQGAVFFWVFPWKVATVVFLGILIVVLGAMTLYRRFRRRQEELEEKIEKLEEKLEEKEPQSPQG